MTVISILLNFKNIIAVSDKHIKDDNALIKFICSQQKGKPLTNEPKIEMEEEYKLLKGLKPDEDENDTDYRI